PPAPRTATATARPPSSTSPPPCATPPPTPSADASSPPPPSPSLPSSRCTTAPPPTAPSPCGDQRRAGLGSRSRLRAVRAVPHDRRAEHGRGAGRARRPARLDVVVGKVVDKR